MNFKGYPIAMPEAGSVMDNLLKLKDLDSLFITKESIGVNSLAWFNFRSFLARPGMYPDVIKALAGLGNIRNPTDEEINERFQNPNKYNSIRATFAKHIAIKDDKYPFALYMHLKPVDGDLKWVFELQTILFLSRGKDAHEEVQQEAS